MYKYGSTPNLFKRDPDTDYATLIPEFSTYGTEALQDIAWNITEKIDGTNVRAIWNGYTMEFRGRSDKAKLHGGLLTVLQALMPDDKFAGLGEFCIYGEGYGPGINKGGGYGELGFAAFDVSCSYPRDDGSISWKYLEYVHTRELLKSLGVPMAPGLGEATWYLAMQTLSAKPISRITTARKDFVMEGYILRPSCLLFDGRGERIQAKLKLCDLEKSGLMDPLAQANWAEPMP